MKKRGFMDTIFKDIINSVNEFFAVFWDITRKIIEGFWINFIVINLYVGFYFSRAIYHLIRIPSHIWNLIKEISKYILEFFDKLFKIIRAFLKDVFLHIRRFLTLIWDYLDLLFTEIIKFVNNIFDKLYDFAKFLIEKVVYNLKILLPLILLVLPVFLTYAIIKHVFISLTILFYAVIGKPYAINRYRRFFLKPKFSPLENIIIGFIEYSWNLKLNISLKLSGTRKLNFAAVNNLYILLNYILVFPLLMIFMIALSPIFIWFLFLGNHRVLDEKFIQSRLVIMLHPIEDQVYLPSFDRYFGKKIVYEPSNPELINNQGLILANSNFHLLGKKTSVKFKIFLEGQEIPSNIEIPVLFNEDTLLKSYFTEYPPIATIESKFEPNIFEQKNFKIEFEPYSNEEISKTGEILVKDYKKELKIPIVLKVYFVGGKIKNHHYKTKAYLTITTTNPISDLENALSLIPENVYQSNGKIKFKKILKLIKFSFSSPETNVITKSGQILPIMTKDARTVVVKLTLGNESLEKSLKLLPKTSAKKIIAQSLKLPTLKVDGNFIHLPEELVFNEETYILMFFDLQGGVIIGDKIELPNIRVSSFTFSILGKLFKNGKLIKSKKYLFKINKIPSKQAILEDFQNIKSKVSLDQQGNLVLPNSGPLYGSNVTWLSHSPSFYSSQGKKNKKFDRKKFLEDKLTFTALIEYDNRSLQKNYDFEIGNDDLPILNHVKQIRSNNQKLDTLKRILGYNFFEKITSIKYNFFDWPRLLSFFSLFFFVVTSIHTAYPIYGLLVAVFLQSLQVIISMNSLVNQMIKKRLWDSIFSSVMFLLVLGYAVIWIFYPGLFASIVTYFIQGLAGILSALINSILWLFSSIIDFFVAIINGVLFVFSSIGNFIQLLLNTVTNLWHYVIYSFVFTGMIIGGIISASSDFEEENAFWLISSVIVASVLSVFAVNFFENLTLSWIYNVELSTIDNIIQSNIWTNILSWLIPISSGFLLVFTVSLFYDEYDGDKTLVYLFIISFILFILLGSMMAYYSNVSSALSLYI